MEILSPYRDRFKDITPEVTGPGLRLSTSDVGSNLRAGFFIFGTAERVCRLDVDFKAQSGTWFEAFRWPEQEQVQDELRLDWVSVEERFTSQGLQIAHEDRFASSGLGFQEWVRSRLEKILKLDELFQLHPWAYEEVEAESVLERVQPALEAFVTGELLRSARPILASLGIASEMLLSLRQEFPEGQKHEFLAFLDAIQAEKALRARALAKNADWSELFQKFLEELETGQRTTGNRRIEDFEDWWRDSGVNAAMIAAAPEIPDAALKRALRKYPI